MNITYNWKENISRWDEAVPLGNGKCGCLCWGSPEEIRFSLDRTDLWDRTVLWEQNKEFTWKNLVKLAKAGNTAKIRHYGRNIAGPGRILPDSYGGICL